MSDFQQRVIDECNALTVKRTKLADFLVTTAFKALPDADRILLICQQEAMATYQRILEIRIKRFMENTDV